MTFLRWTFGRGSVIWRIWPAVLLHTVFAAVVVSVSLKTRFKLGIPNVMLTLLGVVIGFVISYRASSGYDRYWAGRTAWSDVMRNSRTFGRLIWFHVPLLLKSEDASLLGSPAHLKERAHEIRRAMSEKHMAFDLVEAYAVSLKHHLRGEMGIYYEDLFGLVRPLHEHHHRRTTEGPSCQSPERTASANAPVPSESAQLLPDFAIPPINSYGAVSSSQRPLRTYPSTSSFSHSSNDEERQLLPSITRRREGVMSGVSEDMIPFSSFASKILEWGRIAKAKLYSSQSAGGAEDIGSQGGGSQRWEDTYRNNGSSTMLHSKHRPRVAGGGENIPLEVIRSLTVWLSVLEHRGTVPGTTLGGMFACLAAFEDSLSVLERILTTPLPFVFSVHIRHTVWIYLFFLPFQLVDQFQWYTIPGVCIAAFIYLGFVGSGEEIEQPFGYDENDLDLDMFCREIIQADFEHLKRTDCPNVFLGSHHEDDDAIVDKLSHLERAQHGKVEEVFGRHSARN